MELGIGKGRIRTGRGKSMQMHLSFDRQLMVDGERRCEFKNDDAQRDEAHGRKDAEVR